MIAVPPASGTDWTVQVRVVSSRPSRLVRTSGSTNSAAAAARPKSTQGRINPRPATLMVATPAPAASFMRPRRPITCCGRWACRVRSACVVTMGFGERSMALSPLSRAFTYPMLGRGANWRSECPRLRQDHDDADHAGVDRAVKVVGPGVGEGDAVAALIGKSLTDGRVQVLLGEQDARCSLAIGIRIT